VFLLLLFSSFIISVLGFFSLFITVLVLVFSVPVVAERVGNSSLVSGIALVGVVTFPF
jgi:hypothetical protein